MVRRDAFPHDIEIALQTIAPTHEEPKQSWFRRIIDHSADDVTGARGALPPG